MLSGINWLLLAFIAAPPLHSSNVEIQMGSIALKDSHAMCCGCVLRGFLCRCACGDLLPSSSFPALRRLLFSCLLRLESRSTLAQVPVPVPVLVLVQTLAVLVLAPASRMLRMLARSSSSCD